MSSRIFPGTADAFCGVAFHSLYVWLDPESSHPGAAAVIAAAVIAAVVHARRACGLH